MSRVGRKPIPIPEGVKVRVEGDTVVVEGPQGRLTQRFEPEYVDVIVDNGEVRVARKGDEKPYKARHGLYRSLIHNMVQGVVKPYEKRLQLVGLGYRARLEGRTLVLEVGYSHPVRYPLPEGVQAEVNDVRTSSWSARWPPRSAASASRSPTRARASATRTSSSSARSGSWPGLNNVQVGRGSR